MPNGSFSGSFYIQGVSPSASDVTITATDVTTTPLFGGDAETIQVVQPAISLTGITASRTKTTLSTLSNDSFFVSVGIPNAAQTGLLRGQGVSAGAGPLTLSLSNSNAALGEILIGSDRAQNIDIDIPVNGTALPSTPFLAPLPSLPEGVFETTVSATASGFIDTFASQSQTITVNAPAPISLSAGSLGTVVGAGLQIRHQFSVADNDR